LSNTFFTGDRISCACNPDAVSAEVEPSLYRDANFGNSWSWVPPLGAAIYGRTEELPPTPIEEAGSGRFLRVPYRRIPVIDVHSVSDLIDIAARVWSANADVRGVWRGQARHYNLQRTDDDKLRLYGSVAIEEPSLLPSASRNAVYFPDLFLTWAGLLDLYIEERANGFAAIDSTRRSEVLYQSRNFRAGYNYRLWGFATAQHYGVPSVGLDVTSDIRVALFFALHRFTTDKATGVMSMERASEADSPIIYGMGGFQYDLFDDAKLTHDWLLCERPKAQSAMFFGTGWEESKNKAADRIYVALRLVGHTSWASPLTGREIFPGVTDDPFLDFLLKARAKYDSPLVRDILSYIYFVP